MKINGLNYHVASSGAGPSLVMLHGFTGSAASWQPVAGALARYCRPVTGDLIGHGQSEAPSDPARYTLDHVARDVFALIEALTQPPVVLLGYSMGGRVALYLATQRPDLFRAVILESASPGLADPTQRAARRAQDDALADRIEREGITAFVDYWETLPLWASQARLTQVQRDQLRALRLKNDPVGLANCLRGFGTGVQPDLWPTLSDLRLPVLLIVGEDDAKFRAINAQMAAALPNAHLTIVPQAGHTVHLEQPDAYTARVLAFLDAVASSPSTGVPPAPGSEPHA